MGRYNLDIEIKLKINTATKALRHEVFNVFFLVSSCLGGYYLPPYYIKTCAFLTKFG